MAVAEATPVFNALSSLKMETTGVIIIGPEGGNHSTLTTVPPLILSLFIELVLLIVNLYCATYVL